MISDKEKEADREKGKEEYMSNQTKSYVFRNRGLYLKIKSMEILSKRMEELDNMLDSQSQEERNRTLAIMAELGKAIIND